MTYQEVNDRLTRVQTALQSLQDGSYANSTGINVPQMTSQLQEVEAKLQEQLLVLSEAEKTAFVNGQATEYTDEKELQKLKDNQDVKSIKTAGGKKIKEEAGLQFSLEETKAIAREIGKAVAKGLKSMGDELASMKVKNIEEGSFDIHVQYKKDTSTDDFSFYITGDDLHLVDFSFDKVIGGVGVKPSGEPIVHVDVIANELTKHWKSQMKEGMSDEEWANAEEKGRLEDHPEKDMIKKIQALIAKEKKIKEGEGASEEEELKEWGSSDQNIMNQSIHKDLGEPTSMPSPFSQELESAVEDAVDNYWNDWEEYDTDREGLIEHAKKAYFRAYFKETFNKMIQMFSESQVNEAPEGMSYLEVSVRDARKAMAIMDDRFRGQFEMNGSNVYYFNDDSMAYDAMMDLGAQGIEIVDTNIEEGVRENETPDGGMDQGGDLDVGHQDDEPNMLKKDLYDIATYAAKLYKQLDKYDKHDGEVDFPHWWQKKVTLAREYISSAQHYLEAEEKQPALDQLALERVVKDNESPTLKAKIAAEDFMSQYRKAFRLVSNNFGKEAEAEFKSIIKAKFAALQEGDLNEMVDPSYADMLAQFIILMGSGYGALQAVKKLGDETGDISLDSVKKAIKKYKDGDVSEIGMFHDPVGYEKSKPETPTYTKKYVSKNVYDIFKHGKKVKTVKGSEGEANAWMNNASKGQQNEAAEGQSISDLKPGDKFEFNGKTYTLVKHIEGNIAKVIRPNGDTSTVSFGGKINTGKKAGIGPDAFGQGKGHHIDEAQSTCCGKCGRKHVKGTKCKTPYLKGKDHCRTR